MYGVIRNDIVNKQKLTLSSTQEQPLAKQSQILRSLKNRIKNLENVQIDALDLLVLLYYYLYYCITNCITII